MAQGTDVGRKVECDEHSDIQISRCHVTSKFYHVVSATYD